MPPELLQQLAAAGGGNQAGMEQQLMNVLQNPEMLQALMNGAGGQGGALPENTIQVTAEEKAALDRLQSMGFSRQRVIEAYFACDKNEDMALNFLLDQGNFPMEEDEEDLPYDDEEDHN